MGAMLEAEQEERFWREYMASHLWYAASALFASRGIELKTENYAEIMHKEVQDTRTPEQIKDDIYKKFKG